VRVDRLIGSLCLAVADVNWSRSSIVDGVCSPRPLSVIPMTTTELTQDAVPQHEAARRLDPRLLPTLQGGEDGQ
jgi:hypothetical protein